MRETFIAVLLLGLVLEAAPALAQREAPASTTAPDPANKEPAEKAMREGNRLLARGQHAEALAKFEEAHALYPSPRLQFNRAQALQGIPGREVETLEALLSFLHEAPNARRDLRSAAEKEMRKLRAQLALLRIDAEPAGATVLIDGRAMATAPMDRPHVSRPGRVRLEVRHPGHDPFGPEEIELMAGEELNRKVVLLKTSAGPLSTTTAPLGSVATTPPPVVGGSPLLPSVQSGNVPGGPDLHESSGPSAGVPFYKRGWFWAAAAGTVAAGVVVGLLVARSGDPARRYECPAVPGGAACERLP